MFIEWSQTGEVGCREAAKECGGGVDICKTTIGFDGLPSAMHGSSSWESTSAPLQPRALPPALGRQQLSRSLQDYLIAADVSRRLHSDSPRSPPS